MTYEECRAWNALGFSPQCNVEQPVIVQPPPNVEVHTVPEPATYALLGLELVVLAMALRRR